ncbi:hypothetical protein BC835DRAFT_1413450 [Cytidiella melzeri]|nr:hypothetical protein BC835DRAFT_1413450 [Cytidiella melzeri]
MLFFTPFLFALLALADLSNALPFPFNTKTHRGTATFYDSDPGAGACGGTMTNIDIQLAVAVSSKFFDSYPGAGDDPTKNPLCGKALTITDDNNGWEVTATIFSKCDECDKDDLKLSLAAFMQIDDTPDSSTKISWHVV